MFADLLKVIAVNFDLLSMKKLSTTLTCHLEIVPSRKIDWLVD